MRTAFLVVACLYLALVPAAAGETLYGVRVDEAESVIALADRGAAVRHIGNEGIIVQADDDLGAALRRAGFAVERLGEVGDWEGLYLCYPRSRETAYGGWGDVLWVDPKGAVLVGADASSEDGLRAASFMVVSLPEAIDVRAWFDDAPPPHIAGRTRADERRVEGLVADAMDSVSTSRLVDYVEGLSIYLDGTPRTRYIARKECLTIAKPYIVHALAAALPETSSIWSQRFKHLQYTCQSYGDEPGHPLSEYALDNIVGVLEGNGDLPGCYILCAHYDATASHDFPGNGLWWCDNPAPGADDNATGVATVLEAARVLSRYTFPFDVRFILFSGEEQGLLGSEVYADSAAAAGDTIYGVINVDMIAYKRSPDHPDTCHVVASEGSRWLGTWIVDTAEVEYPEHFDGFDALRIDAAPINSDQGSFWLAGYDAVLAIEHENPRDRNPNYHTLDDMPGTLFPSQLASTTRMVVGSVARLADPSGTINLALFQGDVSLNPGKLWVGSSTTVSVDLHIFGPSEHVSMTLDAWDGRPGAGELLSSLSIDRVMGGGEAVRHGFEWYLDDADLGEHTLTFVVSTDDTDELTERDNTLTVDVRVNDPDRLFVMDHYVYPNPAETPDRLNFRYELSRAAQHAVVTVYDLLGQERWRIERSLSIAGGGAEGSGTEAGWNSVPWLGWEGDAPDLPSGVYVYRLEVYGGGRTDPDDAQSGKFAVVR